MTSLMKKIVRESHKNFKNQQAEFNYKVLYSKRKTLSLQVKPDLSVIINAPIKTSDKYLEKILANKANWILAKQKYFAENKKFPRQKNYEDGEKFIFLGMEYSLKIERDLLNNVCIKGSNLVVKSTIINKVKIKNLIDNFYKNEAIKIISERFQICQFQTLEHNIICNAPIKFRKMRARWGNCTSRGEITFNSELVKTPIECIDYVIIHELCHLVEFNHSKNFYNLVARFLPDWKFRKKKLNEFAEYDL
jgi:predicted metal-dependent hydrolase